MSTRPSTEWCKCGHSATHHRTNERGSCMACNCKKFRKSQRKEDGLSVQSKGRSQAALILGEVMDVIGTVGIVILAGFVLAQFAK